MSFDTFMLIFGAIGWGVFAFYSFRQQHLRAKVLLAQSEKEDNERS